MMGLPVLFSWDNTFEAGKVRAWVLNVSEYLYIFQQVAEGKINATNVVPNSDKPKIDAKPDQKPQLQ